VIIERGFPDNYLPYELGYALPDALTGVNAAVFYDRIERLHKSADIDLSTLLGHAMAHEIGHVLLGAREHSPRGIMKARWSQSDFWPPEVRFMAFSDLQRQQVQHRLMGRLTLLNLREQSSSISTSSRVRCDVVSSEISREPEAH
jgi:hypothetical protein